MTKIITVVGARPQFVKAAVVSRALKETGIKEVIVHTGQHFDENMSDIFFEEMMIPKPDHHLQISNLGHGAMTGRMLEGIESLLLSEKPSHVMVYGDTNSTLAGALAAAKLHIDVVHVEAGLRSFNMNMPEEQNRILTDRLSSLLFCPTDQAVKNLKNEGYDHFDGKIVKCGDVMQDAALFYASMSKERSKVISELEVDGKEFVLATVHRQENTNDLENLKSIFDAFEKINKQKRVILPLHPRTRKILEREGIATNISVIDPVGYFDMLELLKNCSLVITDSGGLQKEAFFFEKQCITIREETEWVELVDGGYNTIAGADNNRILNAFEESKNKSSDFSIDLYGGGKASDQIAEVMNEYM